MAAGLLGLLDGLARSVGGLVGVVFVKELTKCSFACACKKVRPCATFERAHLAELYASLCQVR